MRSNGVLKKKGGEAERWRGAAGVVWVKFDFGKQGEKGEQLKIKLRCRGNGLKQTK